jgi:hypothetical protein
LLLVAYAGVVIALFRRRRGDSPLFALRHLPFVAAASSLLFFTLVVGRAEHRFLLPFGLFLSAGGGIACDALLAVVSPATARQVATVVMGMGFAWAGVVSSAVHLTQLGDARRAVTRFLATSTQGTRVETYGLTVYQPHFDVSPTSPYRVARVGPDRPRSRNPLVGAAEVQAAIGDAPARRPDVIVISEGFANAYLKGRDRPFAPASKVVRARRDDPSIAPFVRKAVANELSGYRQVLVARAALPAWATALGLRPVRIQSTTGSTVWVLARIDTHHAAEPAPSSLPVR